MPLGFLGLDGVRAVIPRFGGVRGEDFLECCAGVLWMLCGVDGDRWLLVRGDDLLERGEGDLRMLCGIKAERWLLVRGDDLLERCDGVLWMLAWEGVTEPC